MGLKEFSKRLKEEEWGSIEPEWFDPDFLVVEDGEEMTEEQVWARQLQDLVRETLAGEQSQ